MSLFPFFLLLLLFSLFLFSYFLLFLEYERLIAGIDRTNMGFVTHSRDFLEAEAVIGPLARESTPYGSRASTPLPQVKPQTDYLG